MSNIDFEWTNLGTWPFWAYMVLTVAVIFASSAVGVTIVLGLTWLTGAQMI